MAKQRGKARRQVGGGWQDRYIAIWIGLLGASFIWLIWQLINAPSPGSWNDNLINPGAGVLALTTGSVIFGVATFVESKLDRRERDRYEQRIAELERGLKDERENAAKEREQLIALMNNLTRNTRSRRRLRSNPNP